MKQRPLKQKRRKHKTEQALASNDFGLISGEDEDDDGVQADLESQLSDDKSSTADLNFNDLGEDEEFKTAMEVYSKILPKKMFEDGELQEIIEEEEMQPPVKK